MNNFLDKDYLSNDNLQKELIDESPLRKISQMMKPVNSLIKTIAKNKEGQSKLLTKNEQNFDEFVQDELGDTVFIDETTGRKISKGS